MLYSFISYSDAKLRANFMSEEKKNNTEKVNTYRVEGDTSQDISHDTDKTDASENKRRAGEVGGDFIQKTTVLSRNNPILKRALSNQLSGENGDDEDDEKLTGKRELLLIIRTMTERLTIEENKRYKLGRFDLGPTADDEIDLTPYGAQDRGVSRIHAEIHIEKGVLYVTDLESTNGTYLGGSKLMPNESRALRKGDELLLGRLAVQIMFH